MMDKEKLYESDQSEDLKEMNEKIHQLTLERARLMKKQEESKYEDWFNQIIQKGSIDEDKLFDHIEDIRYLKTLYYTLSWRDVPKNSPERFIYNGYKVVDDFTDDGNYVHFYYIQKSDKSNFNLDEIKKFVPDLEDLVEYHKNKHQNKLEIFEKFQKELEKVNKSAK